jgi:pyridoxal phosphate enzyme (YggS family)
MSSQRNQEIIDKYNKVLSNIDKAARKAGRNPEDIHLVVVSKYKPVEVIEAAITAGAKIFGENYPEQAVPKIECINNPKIEWHMIGHLQSRKAVLVVDHFSLLHSLDSEKLANKLNTLNVERGQRMRVLIEVNLSGEESKNGWAAWNEDHWHDLIIKLGAIVQLPGLQVEGLMTMPPLTVNPEDSRKDFVKLRRLQDRLMKDLGEEYWRDLSIGTSHDFEIAIEEGARYVRIGQAILGEREFIK